MSRISGVGLCLFWMPWSPTIMDSAGSYMQCCQCCVFYTQQFERSYLARSACPSNGLHIFLDKIGKICMPHLSLFIALAFRNRLECYCADGCITARIPLHRKNLVSFHPATLEFTGLECIWIVLGLIGQHLLRGSTARLSGLLVMRLCHAFPGFCLLWEVAFKQFLNRTGEKPFIQSRFNTAELRSELCMQQHGYYICNMYSIYPIVIAKYSCKKFNSFLFIIDHFTNKWLCYGRGTAQRACQ